MARVLLPLALLVLGGLTWFMLKGSDAPAPTRHPPGSAASEASAPEPLPPLNSGRPEPEGPIEGATPPPKVIEAIGPLGRDASVLAERMKVEDGWRPVESPPYTWVNPYGTQLTFKVVNGKVVGASAGFAPRAMSADLKAISPWLVGNQDALPIHWEVYRAEDAQAPQAGTFQSSRGTTIHYRGTLRSEGEPPYGPETLEISLEPFPATP